MRKSFLRFYSGGRSFSEEDAECCCFHVLVLDHVLRISPESSYPFSLVVMPKPMLYVCPRRVLCAPKSVVILAVEIAHNQW